MFDKIRSQNYECARAGPETLATALFQRMQKNHHGCGLARPAARPVRARVVFRIRSLHPPCGRWFLSLFRTVLIRGINANCSSNYRSIDLVSNKTLYLMKIVKIFLIGLSLLCFGAAVAAFDTAVSTENAAITYDASLIEVSQQGANEYAWTWTVTNPNPGNGSDGTLQNLSHWSMAVGDVIRHSNIVSVSYSLDGLGWTELPVSLAIDKSQDCYTNTVLKFDYGTVGSEPTYYKLVVNAPFAQSVVTANFKSGKVTGCYNGYVASLGAPGGTGPVE